MIIKKNIPISLFATLLFIDITHYLLNEIYKPYNGFGDEAIHTLLMFSGMFYIWFLVYLSLKVNDSFTYQLSTNVQSCISGALILILMLEAIYAFNYGDSDNIKKTSASGYNMLWPLYFGGIVPGLLTAVLTKLTFTKKKALALFYLVAQFWVAGPIVTDNLFIGQGGYRGFSDSNNPLPFITYLDIAYQYAFILILILGVILIAIGGLIGAVYSVYYIFKNKENFKKNKLLNVSLNHVALSCSLVFLSIQLADWAGFISD